ncbi:MAG TPA: RNA polymerase sigma factor, partial [Solirubrobacteraceae bacterium]|nr:RNA polymerase sigma factor [Solirubrobacteraceae bacterium]
MRLLSDDRLVALIRDGNTNAFEAVYDRHYRAILSFCRHMLGCADEAEDAVQHTFLAAYNDLVSSRKPIRLRAWLFTIARNRCLSILRARRERTALEFEERATDGLAVQVQRRQDLRDLVVDINHLPDDQRAALVLAEMGALSHDEIGSVLGVPKDKVKALIFQARESLLADRAAREADCREIREQLATMRGAALRRTTLRRHLRGCQGCREYRHELERQRRRLALILPVAPTIALREAVLGATAGGGIAGAGVAGGGLLGAASVVKGVAGKALIGALVAAAGTTGTMLVVHDFRLHGLPRPEPYTPAGTATSVLGATTAQLASSTSRTVSRSATGTGTSSTTAALAGSSGLVVGGHQTATAKAIVHALTGQLTNLLTPTWPHEKLGGGGSVLGPTATPTPTGTGMLVPVAPVPTTSLPEPVVALPGTPGALLGTSPGPYSGGTTLGGPGPAGLSSGSAGGLGSSGGSGSGSGTPTPVPVTGSGGAGGPPVPVPVTGSGGAGGTPVPVGSPDPTDGGTGTPVPVGSPDPTDGGTGTGSDPGPGPGPIPAPPPTPEPAPTPTPAPTPA